MATVCFDGGKIVELSEETTERLWKELFPDAGQLKADKFRALKTCHGAGLRLAIMNRADNVSDGEWYGFSNAKAAEYFLHAEIKQIIAGLTRILDE